MCRYAHPQLRMKRVFKTIIAALCFTAVACTDYQVDIDSLNDRIDSLEKTQIANITQQINAINESLPLLQNADAELKDLIASLNKMAEQYSSAIAQNEEQLTKFKAEIEKSIEALRAEIETSQNENKQDMLDALNAAKAEIEAQIAALQTDTNGKLDQMNTALAALQAKDESIGARIDALKLFVEEELTSTKDWATKTFATLAQQQAIQDDISAIKGNITSLQNSLTAMETRLTENYTKAIQNAVSQLEGKLSATAAQILKDYTAAIQTAKEEITAAYEQKLSDELEALEEDLKDWVNETLKSYAKIADMQTAISTLKGELEGELKTQSGYITALQKALGDTSTLSGTIAELIKANQDAISTNQKSIEDLNKALETAKKDIKKNYEAAIEDAVKEDGVVDELIAKRIKEYHIDLTKTIEGINSEITGIKTRVSNLETNMGTLRDSVVTLTGKLNAFISDRIQSITYIPGTENGEYMSGMVDYNAYGDFTLAFQIRPAKNAAKITDLKQISAKKVAYNTHNGYSTQLFDNVTVNNFLVMDDVLYVNFKASDVFYNNTEAYHYDYRRVAISVSVKDNANEYFDVASEYVYLNSEHYFMNYTSSYSVFNPYTFKLNSGAYGYNTISHLGYNFVDVNSKVNSLKIRFAESNKNPNQHIRTMTFGEVGKQGLMYNMHPVYLETGADAFSNCTYLESVDFGNGLRTDNVTSFESMFSNCTNLKSIRTNNLNTAKVTNMNSMFSNCDKLDTLDLRSFNTGSLTTALNMFINCDNLKVLDLRGWDVSKLTNLTGMFADSPNLTNIRMDWSKFSNETITLFATFRGTGITKVDISVPVITISDLHELFQNCKALTTVKLSGKATIKNGNMNSMFEGCTKLTSVDLTGWIIDGKADLSNMFKGCSELTTITLDGWKLTSDTVITDMLKGCTKLATVNIKGCDDNTWDLIGKAVNKLSQTVNVNRK